MAGKEHQKDLRKKRLIDLIAAAPVPYAAACQAYGDDRPCLHNAAVHSAFMAVWASLQVELALEIERQIDQVVKDETD